ncbi:MAG: helix-turn-helix domain-containing protein [Rhodanobacteraceae bacterium]
MTEQAISIPLPNLKVVLKSTKGLSQRGLAAFLGIHESNISRLIQGKAKMLTRERIKLIEQYTGKSFEYLADLKSAQLTDEEESDLRAMRNAPPDLIALLRKNLDPYR